MVTMKSAPMLLSMMSLALFVIEAASTPPAATRASPIIRAEAVAAVRRGLRQRVLPGRAARSSPRTLEQHAPTPPATGRLSSGLSIATPRKMPGRRARPRGSRRRDQAGGHAGQRRRASTRVPKIARRRSERPAAATSSRSAASGGTRLARRAGARAATTVTITPVRRPRARCSPGRRDRRTGRSPKNSAEQALQPEGEQDAEPETESRAEQADDQRLEQTARLTWPRLAPSTHQRELAGALGDQHQNVLKMMNARRRARSGRRPAGRC